jgi:ribosomal protein L7/L12
MSSPPKPFPPDVLEALAQGKPLEAIKRLRRAGFGLAEAKAALEAYGDPRQSRSSQPVRHAGHTFEDAGRVLPAEVIDALGRGDKMGAIRLLRERTGLGLKEASRRVDAANAGSADAHIHRAPTSNWTPTEGISLDRSGLGQGEVPSSNTALWIVLAILATLVGYYAW